MRQFRNRQQGRVQVEHHHGKSYSALILSLRSPHSSAGGRVALRGHSLAKASETWQHFFLDIHNTFQKKKSPPQG